MCFFPQLGEKEKDLVRANRCVGESPGWEFRKRGLWRTFSHSLVASGTSLAMAGLQFPSLREWGVCFRLPAQKAECAQSLTYLLIDFHSSVTFTEKLHTSTHSLKPNTPFNATEWLDRHLFTHFTGDGSLGCLQFGVIRDSAAWIALAPPSTQRAGFCRVDMEESSWARGWALPGLSRNCPFPRQWNQRPGSPAGAPLPCRLGSMVLLRPVCLAGPQGVWFAFP